MNATSIKCLCKKAKGTEPDKVRLYAAQGKNLNLFFWVKRVSQTTVITWILRLQYPSECNVKSFYFSTVVTSSPNHFWEIVAIVPSDAISFKTPLIFSVSALSALRKPMT